MADNTTIRPFHFEASQTDLADLRKRISATKWPERKSSANRSDDTRDNARDCAPLREF